MQKSVYYEWLQRLQRCNNLLYFSKIEIYLLNMHKRNIVFYLDIGISFEYNCQQVDKIGLWDKSPALTFLLQRDYKSAVKHIRSRGNEDQSQ